VDMSSLNELINKDDFSMYVGVDDAIRFIQDLGPGAQLCKFDIADAFKQIPIHHSLYHLQQRARPIVPV